MNYKFRFWDKECREMFEWEYALDGQTLKTVFMESGHWIPLLFTGKYDKDHNEIYQAHIIEGRKRTNKTLGPVVRGPVLYDVGMASFRIDGVRTGDSRSCSLSGVEDILVIGNIFEDSELIPDYLPRERAGMPKLKKKRIAMV